MTREHVLELVGGDWFLGRRGTVRAVIASDGGYELSE